jgi:two-component system response regulator AtoC
MKGSSVWIVDDDAGVRSYLSDFLGTRGYETHALDSGDQVLRRLTTSPPPLLMLLDIRMPRVGGLELLSELDKRVVRIPSIVLSGVGSIPTVVEAMRLGASDYLVKPIEEEKLEAAMARVFVENGDATLTQTAFETSNPRMLAVRAVCDRVAHVDVPVLVLGESGVGKEVVARYIHARSGRRGAFVKVNCAALPADLLESELFGHERGAFTGAQREKPGKFELADEGTLMLDELGEMSPLLQAKLLHVLQDGEYSRVGGTQTLTSTARIIAATNQRLQSLVSSGGFREDLYFRINVITVQIPPLRERREDIGRLCQLFIERYRERYGSRIRQLPPELMNAFREYHWPGNVRQLENLVKRFLILPDLHQLLADLEDRPPAPLPDSSPQSLSLKELSADVAERAEKELIFQTLDQVNWNRRKAAQRLNICYKSLLNKLHRWQSEDKRPEESAGERRPASMTTGSGL